MPSTFVLTVVLIALAFSSALGASITCRDKGPCVCTQTINPAGVLGYNATVDHQSVMVDITCINTDTMRATFYERTKEDGLGASYTSSPTPHD
jgi:hypothetical protein